MKYNELVKIMRVLAGRKRLEILNLLSDARGRSVSDIAEHIKLSLKSTSKHVLLLAQVDLLDYRRQKNVVWYKLSAEVPPYLKTILGEIRRCS